MTREKSAATFLATLVVVSAVAGVAALGMAVSPVAADQHTFETATDYTDEANFTVQFPFTTDHYPGSQNEENGSIQYSAVGAEAMRAVGAEDGAFIDTVVIAADWIDYSACATDNTAVFGIDRGNDNRGTQYDEDLISRMKRPVFRDDGLTVTFYEWSDLGGDPPYAAADDAIVAEQGARSTAGACLTVTDEPGWYQVQGFINGTAADNGPDEQPSADAAHAGIYAKSDYMYVCECDSEQEAREQLGPPPNESPGDGADDSTPTPTPNSGAQTSTPSGDGAETPTATVNGGGPTPTAGDDPATTPTPTAGGPAGDTGDGSGDGTNDGAATPTAQEGPGFGAIAALLGLLAGSLLAYRRG